MADTPKILFIMGTARSGTTVLEILLANSARVRGVGEVTHIFRDGFVDGGNCACGESTRQCPVWSQVRTDGAWTDADVATLRAHFEGLESHAGFARVALGLVPDARYVDANRKLFSALATVLDADVVIDSSKFASRALLLARAFPGRVRVLCLTRDGAGLVRSFSKPNREEQIPKHPGSAFAYAAYVLLCARVVRWILPDVFNLRFERLRAEPAAVCRELSQWSGIDFSASAEIAERNGEMEVGHIVTGNRLRRDGRIRLQRGGEETPLAAGARLAAAAIDLVRNTLRF